jgi:hypothetical protein
MRRRTRVAGAAAAAGASTLTGGGSSLGIVTPTSAATRAADWWRAGLARLHWATAARMARGELPGIVTVVAHGDVAHVGTIGARFLGGTDPTQRGTPFRIGSLASRFSPPRR